MLVPLQFAARHKGRTGAECQQQTDNASLNPFMRKVKPIRGGYLGLTESVGIVSTSVPLRVTKLEKAGVPLFMAPRM
jgi:hypothetical protein